MRKGRHKKGRPNGIRKLQNSVTLDREIAQVLDDATPTKRITDPYRAFRQFERRFPTLAPHTGFH